MAAYKWPPDLVWELELCEALGYLREAFRRDVGVVLFALMCALDPTLAQTLVDEREPMTPEEEYGEAMAEEIKEVLARQRALLERKRHGG